MSDPIRSINRDLAPEEALIGAAAGAAFLWEIIRSHASSVPAPAATGTAAAAGSSASTTTTTTTTTVPTKVSLIFKSSIPSTFRASATQATPLKLSAVLTGPPGTYTVAVPIAGPSKGPAWTLASTRYAVAGTQAARVTLTAAQPSVALNWAAGWTGNAGTWTTKGLVTVAGQTTTFQGPTFTVTVTLAQLPSGAVSAPYNSVSVVQGSHLPDLIMTLRNPFAQATTFTVDMQSTGGPTITWVVDTRKSLPSGVSAVSGPNAPSQPNSRAKVTLAAGASAQIPWTALMQAAPAAYNYTATKIVVGY